VLILVRDKNLQTNKPMFSEYLLNNNANYTHFAILYALYTNKFCSTAELARILDIEINELNDQLKSLYKTGLLISKSTNETSAWCLSYSGYRTISSHYLSLSKLRKRMSSETDKLLHSDEYGRIYYTITKAELKRLGEDNIFIPDGFILGFIGKTKNPNIYRVYLVRSSIPSNY
jgi:predicted transcriptional regulator